MDDAVDAAADEEDEVPLAAATAPLPAPPPPWLAIPLACSEPGDRDAEALVAAAAGDAAAVVVVPSPRAAALLLLLLPSVLLLPAAGPLDDASSLARSKTGFSLPAITVDAASHGAVAPPGTSPASTSWRCWNISLS